MSCAGREMPFGIMPIVLIRVRLSIGRNRTVSSRPVGDRHSVVESSDYLIGR
jgi:hypothetical protein